MGRPLGAVDGDLDTVIDRGFGDDGDQFIAVLHVLAVDGDDDGPGAEASLFGGAFRRNESDENAVGETGRFQHFRLLVLVPAYADGAALGATVLNDAVVDLHHLIGGEGEADALIAAGLGGNGGVDADDFAVNVDEGAAGVAGVDGGVRLDEALELLGAGEVTAGGDGPIADMDGVGGADFQGGEGHWAWRRMNWLLRVADPNMKTLRAGDGGRKAC